MKVDFYFDPSCPFCWITSRWLVQVKDARKLDITWRPFSLAMKNEELKASTKGTKADKAPHSPAHRVLRVIQAAQEKGADTGELYTTFGTKNHIFGDEYTDELIAKVLAELKLPANLLQAADDIVYDKALRVSLDSALEVVGNDVGVPTIIFYSGKNNEKRTGYFGPVLQGLPSVTESLKLWDSLQTMATMDNFYELKRTRPAGGPNTASTAICIP